MVLIPTLTKEERERHERLITQYFSEIAGNSDISIEYIGNGAEKGVYKVTTDNKEMLASAASIDASQPLLEEYNILHHLHQNASNLFPRPLAHYRSSDKDLGDLMVMELMEHTDIDAFKREHPVSPVLPKDLAYAIGYAVAEATQKTGRYMTEPHDGNIMIKEKGGKADIRFCDAIQWHEGSLEDGVRQILETPDERPESFRFIKQFRAGLVDAMTAYAGMSREEATDKLEFMREYNDIF